MLNYLKKILWESTWKKRGRDTAIALSGGRSVRGSYNDYLEAIKFDIKKHLNPSSEDIVLDIGCSGGHFTREIGTIVNFAVGIDLSISMIGTAVEKSKNHNVHFLQGEAKLLPFTDNSFTLIYMYSVFMYLSGISEVETIFQEIKRVLRKGGKCFIGDILDKSKSPSLSEIIRSFNSKTKIINILSEILGRKVLSLFSSFHPDDLLKCASALGMKATILNQKEELQHSEEMFDLLIEIKEEQKI